MAKLQKSLSFSSLVSPSPILQLEHASLAASLDSRELLHDISLAIEKGDRLAIVGPSGAGKTSLLRLLNRLSEPSQGFIAFAGRRYDRLPVIELRRQIALVPQEPKLLGMTVAEAIAYPLVLQDLPLAEIRERTTTWCKRLRIPEDWFKRSELQLSLGQRQLCAIARSLAMQPQVLLLDEPTSALDVGIADRLLQVLSELAETKQTTILMVNHQLELARQFCDRVLYLHSGRVVDNQPRDRFNWEQLKRTLIQAETTDEWEGSSLNIEH